MKRALDYMKIADIAVNILESVMSEKTGEELQTIFNLGNEAFDKMKAIAILASSMVERMIEDTNPETGEYVARSLQNPFEEVVSRGIEQYNQ